MCFLALEQREMATINDLDDYCLSLVFDHVVYGQPSHEIGCNAPLRKQYGQLSLEARRELIRYVQRRQPPEQRVRRRRRLVPLRTQLETLQPLPPQRRLVEKHETCHRIDPKRRQETALALSRVCKRWREVVWSNSSRYFESVWIDDDNHHALPLERARRAAFERGVHPQTVRKAAARFTSRLRHLELADVAPRKKTVQHLRTVVRLRSLSVGGMHAKQWETFWKDNPDLKSLHIERCDGTDNNYRNLPPTLERFESVRSELNIECLRPCARSLKSLKVNRYYYGRRERITRFGRRYYFFDGDVHEDETTVAAERTLKFTALQEFATTAYPTSWNFPFFEASRHLRKLETPELVLDMDVVAERYVRFPNLEHLEVRRFHRSVFDDNFPNLKTLVLGAFRRRGFDVAFPTEATDLENLSVWLLEDDGRQGQRGDVGEGERSDFEKALTLHVAHNLSSLRGLSAFGFSKVQDLLEAAPAGLRVLETDLYALEKEKNVYKLRKFKDLEKLALIRMRSRTNHPPFVELPDRVGTLVVDAYFRFFPCPFRVDRLILRTKDCNWEFLKHCVRFRMRLFRLEVSEYDEEFANRLCGCVVGPTPFVYVPPAYGALPAVKENSSIIVGRKAEWRKATLEHNKKVLMKQSHFLSLVFINSIFFTLFIFFSYWCLFLALIALLGFTTYVAVKGHTRNVIKEIAKDLYCSYELPESRGTTKGKVIYVFASLNLLFVMMFLNTFHVCFLVTSLTVMGFSVYSHGEVDKEIKKQVGETFIGKMFYNSDFIVETAKLFYCS